MATDIADVLAGIIGLGIIFIGVRFLTVPYAAAAAFGVPVARDEQAAGAYLSVKGIRDVACGLFIAVLIVADDSLVLAWFMVVAAVIPLGDMIVVLRHRGPRLAAFGIHGATALVLLAVASLLFV